jgi:hypothetical protein
VRTDRKGSSIKDRPDSILKLGVPGKMGSNSVIEQSPSVEVSATGMVCQDANLTGIIAQSWRMPPDERHFGMFCQAAVTGRFGMTSSLAMVVSKSSWVVTVFRETSYVNPRARDIRPLQPPAGGLARPLLSHQCKPNPIPPDRTFPAAGTKTATT